MDSFILGGVLAWWKRTQVLKLDCWAQTQALPLTSHRIMQGWASPCVSSAGTEPHACLGPITSKFMNVVSSSLSVLNMCHIPCHRDTQYGLVVYFFLFEENMLARIFTRMGNGNIMGRGEGKTTV